MKKAKDKAVTIKLEEVAAMARDHLEFLNDVAFYLEQQPKCDERDDLLTRLGKHYTNVACDFNS